MHNFNQMKLNDQLEIIADHGNYLNVSTTFYDYQIHLCEVNGLLVEVWYNRKIHRAHKVILLTRYHELDKFLQHIAIKSILKN